MSRTQQCLEHVYDVFSSVSKPFVIDGCPCCLEHQNIHILMTTPVREIGEEPLGYFAAIVMGTLSDEHGFRYFLPRILDISIHYRYWWPCREVVLRKLSEANWNAWSVTEINSLLRLFEAFYDDILDSEYDPGGDIDDWICGLSLAGINIAPYLNKLLQPSFENALIEYYEHNSENLQKPKLSNSFWSKSKSRVVINWFNSEEVQATIWRIYEARYK